MRLLIHELAQRASVTVRTLHYYDQIGLLIPNEISRNGYRYYDEENAQRLKLILYFKELGFKLSQIRKLIDSESSRESLLVQQRHLLKLKTDRLNRMIDSIDSALKGERIMDFDEFDMKQIEDAKKTFQSETDARWKGTDAYKQSMRRTGNYGPQAWKKIKNEEEELLSSFSRLIGTSPSSTEAFDLVEKWKLYISTYFYDCSDEILEGLGNMYTQDERFSDAMDRYKEGTAAFMSEAIGAYVQKNKSRK
ncbi:MAG: MerR family transcriptional regulator [Sphaerochaetaceae bacterium]|nr:MerR family transcriptional regulator [Sphaerochaetaceae bacterium]